MIKARRIVGGLALLCLALAYGYGLSREQAGIKNLVGVSFPELREMTRLDEETFSYLDSDGIHYLAVEREQGWGGPMDLALQITPEGRVEKLTLLRHCETPAFLNRLFRDKYFDQYRNRSVDFPFLASRDIDTVSGATVSSKAVARAVQKGGHRIARDYFGRTIDEVVSQPSFGTREICAVLLFSMVFLGGLFKLTKLRPISLTLGLIVLGFYASFPVSFTHLSSLLLGWVAPLDSHLLTWIMVMGAVGLMILFGKNMYCFWLCPFGALQEFFAAISGVRIRLHPTVDRLARLLPVLFTWAALMIIFIFRNPAKGNYEPFGAMFGFEGQGLIWLILPLVIVIAFFIPRFWCRFFCPVGYLLNKGTRIRNRFAGRGRCYEK